MAEAIVALHLHIIPRDVAKQRGFRHYFTGEPCKYGHVDLRYVASGCLVCNRVRTLTNYHKNPEKILQKRAEEYRRSPEATKKRSEEWRKKNPERYKERLRQHYLANAEKIKARSRKWSAENRALKNATNKAWNEANKERALEHQRRHERKKLKSDPVFAMKRRIQCAIRNSLIKGGYTKRSRTFEYLGCTYEQFVVHIEKQFVRGMNWENRHLWHIDHITPTSSAKSEEEMAALHHFTNLRPLWAPDNMAKRDRIEYLI